MKKMLYAVMAAIASMFHKAVEVVVPRSEVGPGVFVGRMRCTDVAILFRMTAGFPGDVNRTHPASIEPCLIDASAPPTLFGQGVLVDPTTQGVRPLSAGDAAITAIYGITVRPYPYQQSGGGMAAPGGVGTPPVSGIMDVAREAYIIINLPAPTGAAKKGGQVFLWVAASAGNHVQGSFEDAATGGSTIALTNAKFNGTPDANGNVEVLVLAQ